MCGIIGYIGTRQAVPVVLDGLRRLEYRGYDSAGLAVLGPGGIAIRRAAGKLVNLEERVYQDPPRGTVGIGHTRWATHGAPSEANAHPQTDASGRIAVVHNGIVENHAALREALLAAGVELTSDTDTELIAQLLGRAGGSLIERVLAVLPKLEGQSAVVALSADEPGRLVAFRQGPPLVVGLAEDECLLASDVTAVLGRTSRIVVLENGDVAVAGPGEVEILDAEGRRVDRPVETVDWDPGRVEKGGYRHFMLKEIHEQPDAIRNTVAVHLDAARTGVTLDALGLDAGTLRRTRRVHLVACGTSWHACLVGRYLIERIAGRPAEVDYASEYRYRDPIVDHSVLAVGVTQSGETADTLAAMALARERGAALATVCNVRGSSAWRMAAARLLTQAGPEIGVASTKAFTTQLVALAVLALALENADGGDGGETASALLGALQRLPAAVARTLELAAPAVEAAVPLLENSPNALYLGRGVLHPIALEGALKLKEVSYIHAEGYPAGEMKHGPIALLAEGFPVIGLLGAGAVREKTVANLMEARARGASVIAVAAEDAPPPGGIADVVLPFVPVHPLLAPVTAVVPLQLLAYRVAVELGHDVDQPRNLAKSVTVE